MASAAPATPPSGNAVPDSPEEDSLDPNCVGVLVAGKGTCVARPLDWEALAPMGEVYDGALVRLVLGLVETELAWDAAPMEDADDSDP